MFHRLFLVQKNSSVGSALEELLRNGLTDHYLLEDEEIGSLIGGFFVQKVQQPLKHSSVHMEDSGQIDWQKQWAFYAKNFKDGLSHISLDEYGVKNQKILLAPGPGFGDLSHPTTHLMLSLMSPFVHQKCVIDMGCGSGILGLAALKMQAREILAIDIDPKALHHTEQNTSINEATITTSDTLPELSNKQDWVVLMNMTFFDQKSVLKEYPDLFSSFPVIASGILRYQESHYLEWVGKKPIQSDCHQNWMGFIF